MAVAIKKEQEHELFLTRTFDASPDVVFKAWTDPAHIARWWGPKGYTNPVCEVDAQPGGAIRIHMRAPDGTVYPMTGVFESIVEPTQIVFTTAVPDQEGNSLFEIRNTISLAPTDDGKTLLTVQASVIKSTPQAAPYLAGMEMGWVQMLDRLADFLGKA
ncbi:MAG TPA: SRPBCC domain-containing protein [Candidatus Acidoferrum sp.]|jgi:uncharacterized protein YndB with AHSA1/START domain